MRKLPKRLLGIVLILLGFLALITPATPGSWLMLIGCELLGIRVLMSDKVLFFLKDKQRQRLRALLGKATQKSSDDKAKRQSPESEHMTR